MSGPDPAGLGAVAARLAATRTELEAELTLLTAEGPDREDISFGKRVGDGTSMAVERLAQVAAHQRLQEMLADVRRAEEKVADGTYGTCDGCGQPIPSARLEALPWAARCITCAAQR